MSLQPNVIRPHAFPENDPDKPFFIWAGSPEDRMQATLVVANKPWLGQLLEDQRAQVLGQYAGHIHGFICAPRDGGHVADKVSLGLASAHALFKGLKRRLIDHDRDSRMHVYVMSPVDEYGYSQSHRPNQQAFPRREPKPLKSVFVAYVEFDETSLAMAREWYGNFLPENATGVIHRWEWITPVDNHELLPINFNDRYEERLW